MDHEHVREVDPEVADALAGERDRQEQTLAMIASENHVSEAVLEAQGSVLTNKYAEGYPGERYYAGCEYADEVETLAIDRAKELWGADHVNVQPHSGTQANQAVYYAVLDPGDKILSLDLNHGGHLSHGHPANFTGQIYEVEQYEVDADTGYIDYGGSARPPRSSSRTSSSPATPRIRARSTGRRFRRPPTPSTPTTSPTSPTSPGSSPRASTLAGRRRRLRHRLDAQDDPGRSRRIVMCDEEFADDIDKAVFPGGQGGPLMHNIAGKAVGFKEALDPSFDEYAQNVVDNAEVLAETLQDHGFSLVSGGTDNHLVLVDLRDSHPDLPGGDAADALAAANIVLNGNTVPGETRSPFNPSGIRVGTAGVTTRGFDADVMEEVGDLIHRVVDNVDSDDVIYEVGERVVELCDEHPLYE